MIRKQSSPSFEGDMSLASPRTDPSTAQWNNFAARAVVKEPLSNSPVTSPNHSTTVRHNQQRPSPVNSVQPTHHHNNHKLQRTPPATVDLSTNSHHLFSEPPLCFCQKLASRSESGEYGVIYDCHYFSASSNQTICGFHVHQQAWQRMAAAIKKKQFVEDAELQSCPYFNLTYCVVFRVTNTAKKASPLSPRCYCNKRTRMYEINHNSKRRICFGCPDASVGFKCNWFAWAEEVAFIRPKKPHHSPVLPLLSKDESSPTSSPQAANIPQQLHDAATPTAVTTSKNREQHQHSLCLLTALTSNKLDSLKLSDYDQPTAFTAEDEEDRPGEKVTMDQQKSLDELLYGSQHPYSITTTTTDDDERNNNNHRNNKFIPTSVRRNISTKVQGDDPCQQQQQHEASLDKDAIVTRHALWDHVHQQHTLINTLQERGMEREQHVNDLQTRLVFMQREIDHLKDVSEKQQRLMQVAIDTETSLRQHSEKQLSSIEQVLELLMEENSTLTLELESRQSSSVVPKEPKCQVCFSADVECAVVPCFHSVYCLSCAHKLKECAICRMPKFSIQKVYLC